MEPASVQKITEVTSRLQTMIICLNNEPVIHQQLVRIESKCRKIISDFRAVLRNEGETLFLEKEKLMATTSIETLAIEEPLKSLQEIGQATDNLKRQIGVVEVEVGNTIEDCRSKIKSKEDEVSSKRIKIDTVKMEISQLENEKRTLERDTNERYEHARQMDKEASEKRYEAGVNRLKGAYAGLAATFLAPFTAGGSLVVLSAGYATLTVLLARALKLEDEARTKRGLATQKEKEAQRVSLTIRDRERDCIQKKQEVGNITDEISGLKKEESRLTDVSNLLSKFVGSIMRLQIVLQNTEVTYADVFQKTKVLKAFNKVDVSKNGLLVDRANSLLDKTKERWKEMENELVQQGLAQKASYSRLDFL